jgi:hypothetical protein
MKHKAAVLSIFLLVSSPAAVLADDAAKTAWGIAKRADWGSNKTQIDWGAGKPAADWGVGGQDAPCPLDMGAAAVSGGVEQYDGLIERYAEYYGIPQYTGLIKAVAMQESAGGLADIMQAAECPYNTRYPKQPGGIQDAAYSLDCGIRYLSDALYKARVQSPDDAEGIMLALQGYNFGLYYIDWAGFHYGGYSKENAALFSEMQRQKLGWGKYGDTEYPGHVLRYYRQGAPWGGVNPELQNKMGQLLSLCGEAGLNVKITCTLRGEGEQNALYAQGRTEPGEVVTNAPYPYSGHNWGIAFDFCRGEAGREYDDGDGFFEKVGAIGKSTGLAWGGDWAEFTDKPHFELPQYDAAQLAAAYSTPDNLWRGLLA